MSRATTGSVALIAVAVIAWVAITRSQAPSSEGEVRGLLVDVQAQEIVHAEALTVRDAAGALHTFRVSAEVAENSDHPVSASHLRQHMAAGDPVIVRFRMAPEGALAVRVLDVPSPFPGP